MDYHNCYISDCLFSLPGSSSQFNQRGHTGFQKLPVIRCSSYCRGVHALTLTQWIWKMCKEAASHVPGPNYTVKGGVYFGSPTLFFISLTAWGEAVTHKYCTPLDSVISRQNDNPWVQWSAPHKDVPSLDPLLTMNPVCSVKGELGGLTATQPCLE